MEFLRLDGEAAMNQMSEDDAAEISKEEFKMLNDEARV